MSRHRCPRQLVGDARLGFREAVFLEPVRQIFIGEIGSLQLGLQVPGRTFGPFLFRLGKSHSCWVARLVACAEGLKCPIRIHSREW